MAAHRKRICRPLALGLVAVASLTSILSFTNFAGAAGNPSVARYLISNPLPGWSPWPSGSELAASGLQKLLQPDDPGVTVAAAGWSSGSHHLIVMLVVLTTPVTYNPSHAVDDACVSLRLKAPLSVHPITRVPNSETGECARTSDGLEIIQAAWSRGATIAVVTGAGLSEAVVADVSRDQDGRLPAHGIDLRSQPTTTVSSSTVPATTQAVAGAAHTSSPSNGLPTWLAAATAGVVVALVLAVLVMRSRRPRRGAITRSE